MLGKFTVMYSFIYRFSKFNIYSQSVQNNKISIIIIIEEIFRQLSQTGINARNHIIYGLQNYKFP